MGGPWFTVQSSKDGWQTLDTLWISNGARAEKARLELRLELLPASGKGETQ